MVGMPSKHPAVRIIIAGRATDCVMVPMTGTDFTVAYDLIGYDGISVGMIIDDPDID